MSLTRRSLVKGTAVAAATIGSAESAVVALADEGAPEVPVPDEVLDCDVLVVGMGLAGSAAVGFASSFGANVIGIDAAPSIFATNQMSIFGNGTVESRFQLEGQEHPLTKEEFFNYVYSKTILQTNGLLLSNMVDVCGTAFDWLMDNGIKYQLVAVDDPEASINDRTSIFYASPAEERGLEFEAMMTCNGAQCLWSTSATQLICDADGAVTGAFAVNDETGQVLQINARGGVILATGGFAWNPEMVKKYFGAQFMSTSMPRAKGDGINLGLSVGGQMTKNLTVSGYEFNGSNPKDSKGGWNACNDLLRLFRIGGLMVDPNGKRFMSEEWVSTMTMYCSEPQIRCGGRFFMIADSALVGSMAEKTINEILGNYLDTSLDVGTMMIANEKYPGVLEDAERAIQEGFAWKADTIEELAEIIGTPELVEQVARYNGYCDAGADGEFYKNPVYLLPVTEPPFYAVECICNVWCTVGGLKTDEFARVVDADQKPIPGVYVAGMDADCWAVPYSLVTTTSTFSICAAYLAARHAAARAVEG